MLATALILQTRGGSPSSKQGKTAVLSEPVGLVGPQILTDPLAQSRPVEWIIYHFSTRPPRIFKPSYGSEESGGFSLYMLSF